MIFVKIMSCRIQTLEIADLYSGVIGNTSVCCCLVDREEALKIIRFISFLLYYVIIALLF